MNYLFSILWFLLLFWISIISIKAQNCNSPDTVRAVQFRNLAKIAEKLARLDSAVYYYQQSQLVFSQMGCYADAAKMATNIILTTARLPDKTLYRQALAQALSFVDTHLPDNDSIKAKIYQIVGTDFLQRQSLDSALLFLQKAKTMFQTANAWRSYVLTCRALAQTAQVKQDYPLMERFIGEGFAATQNQLNNAPDQLAAILQLSGALYYRTGEYDKALAKMQQGLEINRRHLRSRQDTSSLIAFYNNIGLLFIELGDVYKAEGYCLNAQMLSSQTGDFFKGATIHYNLAESFKLRGDSTKAYQNYQQGLDLLAKINPDASIQQTAENYNRSLINLRNGKAEVSPALNQHLQAVEAITQNLNLHVSEPFRKEETYRILAELYAQQSNWTNALDAMSKSLDLSRKIYGEFHPIVARAYYLQADLYRRQNLPNKALLLYQKVLICLTPNFKKGDFNTFAAPNQISDKEIYLYTLYAQSEIWFSQNKLAPALNSINQAIALVDNFRNSVQAQGSKLFLQKKVVPIYELALQILFQLNQAQPQNPTYLQNCFALVEKNKSLLLLDALHTAQARSFGNIPPELLAQERKLNRDIANTEQELFDMQNSKNNAATQPKQQLLLELNSAALLLQANLEKNYPKYYELKYNQSAPNLAQLQKTLGRNTAFIEYFVGNKYIFVLVATRNKAQFYPVVKTSQFENSLVALRTSLTNTTLLQTNPKAAYYLFTKNAFVVYNLYLQPFLPPDCRQLAIVSDGLFNYIPFEALLTQKISLNPQDSVYSFQSLPYLLRQYTINYHYSASLMLLERQQIQSNGHILALAPHYSFSPPANPTAIQSQQMAVRASVSELPGAQLELDILERLFVGDFLRNADANERSFKLYNAQSPHSVVHLAMHGLVDNDRPANSSLLLSYTQDSTEDDMLAVYELNLLNINADLVVLSACETGFGKYERGEGVISIGRGFMYAGVPAVAMTLWSINDHATANLMAYYYQYLAKGMDKDEALRQSKLLYLERANARTAHPFYWASFISLGDNQPIRISKRWTWREYTYLTIGILSVLILIIFLRRRA